MTVDELHGIFTTYEMKIGQYGPSRKEAAFKALKDPKKSKSLFKNHLENSNDEESSFIKKIERGTGKYKGKPPLKCFNCGRIRHFV